MDCFPFTHLKSINLNNNNLKEFPLFPPGNFIEEIYLN